MLDGFKGNLHFYKIGYCSILKLSLRTSKTWILLSPVFVFKFLSAAILDSMTSYGCQIILYETDKS